MRPGFHTVPMNLLLVVAAATGCAGGDAPPLANGLDGAQHAIVHGAAEPGQMSTACFGRDDGEGLYIACSATLITPRLLLTAGHCGSIVSADELRQDGAAWFGEDIGDPADVTGIDDLIVHPDYVALSGSDPGRYDLAVVVLDRDAATVPTWFSRDEASNALVGQEFTAVGYGLTAAGAGDAGHKRSAVITVDEVDEFFLVSRTDTNPDGANTCSGDSGGPVLRDEDDRWIQWGVTSYADSDCTTLSGASRLDVATGWILDRVEAVHGTRDVCLANGWYGDGACDAVCDDPDPDCDPGDDDTDGDDDDSWPTDDDGGPVDDDPGPTADGTGCSCRDGGSTRGTPLALLALLTAALPRRGQVFRYAILRRAERSGYGGRDGPPPATHRARHVAPRDEPRFESPASLSR